MTKVVVAHLGRAGATGAVRRIRSMIEVLRLAGAEVAEVTPPERRPRPPSRPIRATRQLLDGTMCPEALLWPETPTMRSIAAQAPNLVICETVRSYLPAMGEEWPLCMDFVDCLSESYSDRASRSSGAHKLLYRTLTGSSRRMEKAALPGVVRRLAAGRADAATLDADWFPITFDPNAHPVAGEPDHDLIFFGNLGYIPNTDAVERIAAMWPSIRRRRPTTTLLLAGRAPTERVRVLAAEHGWTLVPDVADMTEQIARARVGLAPLSIASGMQIKVIDAAQLRLPQVITPAVAAGIAQDFPVALADSDAELVERILELLDDPGARAELAESAFEFCNEVYSPQRWADWAGAELLS